MKSHLIIVNMQKEIEMKIVKPFFISPGRMIAIMK